MKNKKLLSLLGVAALLLAGNFAIKEAKTVEAATTGVQALFEEYYNGGEYTKHTVINLKDNAKPEIVSQFHAGVSKLERTTYYKGDDYDAFDEEWALVEVDDLPEDWIVTKAELRVGDLPVMVFQDPVFPFPVQTV